MQRRKNNSEKSPDQSHYWPEKNKSQPFGPPEIIGAEDSQPLFSNLMFKRQNQRKSRTEAYPGLPEEVLQRFDIELFRYFMKKYIILISYKIP